jgi:hypothetical protein
MLFTIEIGVDDDFDGRSDFFQSSFDAFEENSEFDNGNENTAIEVQPELEAETEEYNCFDSLVSDMDFSELSGGFRKSFKKVNNRIEARKGVKINKVSVPLDRRIIIQGGSRSVIGKRKISPESPYNKIGVVSTNKQTNRNEIGVDKRAVLYGRGDKKISKVIVPDNRKVIVEGVSKFILSTDKRADACKSLGYYRGEKLKKLVLVFNNDSALDFNLELFNPSMPLAYLHSTSLDLNDKIDVAGVDISYSDILFNLIANPTMIINAKFVFSGANSTPQMDIPLIIKNKSLDGITRIDPYSLSLQLDNMQVQEKQVCFDVQGIMNRPFIPDGMDVAQYKVLAGNTIVMAFWYKQISMKKYFFKEARENKNIL